MSEDILVCPKCGSGEGLYRTGTVTYEGWQGIEVSGDGKISDTGEMETDGYRGDFEPDGDMGGCGECQSEFNIKTDLVPALAVRAIEPGAVVRLAVNGTEGTVERVNQDGSVYLVDDPRAWLPRELEAA